VGDTYLMASGVQPLIIDCGANIGLSTIWHARQFPEARIIAVEPGQSNLEIAAKNLAAYPNACA
jgi:FkbM family methyltransferase